MQYDGKKFQAERERQHKARKEFSPLAEKTVYRIETDQAGVIDEKRRHYAEQLGLPLRAFLRETLGVPGREEVEEVANALAMVVAHALRQGWACLWRPYAIRKRPTADTKITSLDLSDDPTELVDQVTSDAIAEGLQALSAVSGHPLSRGYVLVDEEKGCQEVYPKDESDEAKWVITVDSSDDTAALSKGLGGTILAAAYYKGVGWLAAVACDFIRRRLYLRVRGAATTAIRLGPWREESISQSSFEPIAPSGSIFFLAPSKRKTLKGASVCIYLGKPDRILKTAELGGALLSGSGIKAVHSHGGSRGSVLVAEGVVDCFVEFVKGFKYLDALPGLFLAEGAGAVVIDPDGEGIGFGVDPGFEAILATPLGERSAAFESLRRKFIVAATAELAGQVRALLGGNG